MAFWVGVASREHVQAAVAGGFCQFSHGKEAPLRRLKPGDRLIYYSPREKIRDGEFLQAFTAIGKVLEGDPQQVTSTGCLQPYRRNIQYFQARDASIRPLLPALSFSQGKASWGAILRRGLFPISLNDYNIIVDAMGVTDVLALT